jgi:hypothetical protein
MRDEKRNGQGLKNVGYLKREGTTAGIDTDLH